MGNVGKSLGSIAGIAAPFVGGPLGVALGVGGGLLSSSGNKQKASQYEGQIAGNDNAMNSLFNQYYQPVLGDMLASIRQNETNTGIPHGPVGDPYGLQQQVRDYNPYNQTYQDNGFANTLSNSARGYQTAVDASRADALDSGVQPTSAQAQANMGNIRMAQGADLSNHAYDLANKGNEWLSGNLMNAENTTYNRLLDQNNLSFNRSQQNIGDLGSILGSLGMLNQSAMGSLGGLQQQYSSKSDAFMNQLGNLGQVLGQSGIFGKRPTTAGAGRQGTNQVPSSPTKNGLVIPQVGYNMGVPQRKYTL